MSAPAQQKGLAGVVVAETRLSKVNGEIGKLTYCGYNIMDLAEKASFEEVIYLLWHLKLPNQAELDDFKAQLFAAMALPDDLLKILNLMPKDVHPMAALRTGVSASGLFDPDAEDNSIEGNRKKAMRLTAQITTISAAWGRIREGKDPIAPKEGLSFAANFLYMLNGEEPTPEAANAINQYLILLADHGINASTFTCRVITSTDGDMYSAVVGGIGALKGPKHGGANEAAMQMFFEVAESGKSVEGWFKSEVKEGSRRIMGIGHRVYKAPDPRAVILKAASETLAETGSDDVKQWYAIASKLEAQALADDYFIERKLFANVDYYSAIVLYSIGLPTDMFTPLFAMSRIAGWSAHIIEQWQDNRLIRPRADYVGDMDLPWVALSAR